MGGPIGYIMNGEYWDMPCMGEVRGPLSEAELVSDTCARSMVFCGGGGGGGGGGGEERQAGFRVQRIKCRFQNMVGIDSVIVGHVRHAPIYTQNVFSDWH